MRLFVTNPRLDGVEPRHISNTLWACAKLRINPGDATLNSLLRTISSSSMADILNAQDLHNTLYAVSVLQQHVKFKPNIEQRAWQRLLGEQQAGKVAASTPQHVSNTLFSLACLSSAAVPVVQQEDAQEFAEQMLQGPAAQQLQLWNDQDIGDAMWACAKLGVGESTLLQEVASAAAAWVPRLAAPTIHQLAYACGTLQLQQPQLLGQLIKRTQQLLSPDQGGKNGPPKRRASGSDKLSNPAILGWAVAVLDMQHLAGDARRLVEAALQQLQGSQKDSMKGCGQLLWVLHSWLVQQQLLDGKGLAGVLTERQLAACQAEAAVAHTP
jgi:hypothetical protein